MDVAERAGLRQASVYGGIDRKRFIIETNGAGVAWLDYDDDGKLDAFVLSGTRLAPTDMGLLEMLHAGDALVTVESLSAVEALAVGRPVLLLNTPTNLRELVDEGVALGVPEGEDPGPALHALLFDAPTRERLASARERYLSRVACGIDGRATERLLKLLRETAAGQWNV